MYMYTVSIPLHLRLTRLANTRPAYLATSNMKSLQIVAEALALLSIAACTVAAPTAGSTDNTGAVAGDPFSGASSSITREEILEHLFTTAKEGKLAKRTPGGVCK